MSVPRKIDTPIRVRFEECRPGGEIRASAFLRYAQDAAWVHSDLAGFDRAWYLQRGLTWVVRCLTLDVLGPSLAGTSLTVTTEVLGMRRILARRHAEIVDTAGGLIATVDTDWLLTGPGFVPVRIPPDFEDAFPAVPSTFEPARVPLPSTPPGAHLRSFHVRRSEIDPMAHVNNAAYVDYLEESLAEAGAVAALDARPRRYALEYQQAAEPGAELHGATWRDIDGWSYRLTDAAGADLLRARFSGG
ncbi:MAG TPA: acyl-ACP thioesterase domain-containing protein [Candidatus Saccharimonadia bacterium]|nr:acyl-ACP thioesterase domain-containing protein [Candidatus Saccharimonadia bacterium]